MGGWISRGWISRFWGAPIFQSRDPKMLVFQGLWDVWTENGGAPKNAKSNHDGPNALLRILGPLKGSGSWT